MTGNSDETDHVANKGTARPQIDGFGVKMTDGLTAELKADVAELAHVRDQALLGTGPAPAIQMRKRARVSQRKAPAPTRSPGSRSSVRAGAAGGLGPAGNILDHSMFVAKVENGERYLAYHTPNKLDVSLSEIVRNNPQANWCPRRT